MTVEQKGEAVFFLAILGELRVTDADTYAGIDLAHWISVYPQEAVPELWDSRDEFQRLAIVQYVRPPAGVEYRIGPRFACCDPAAREAIMRGLADLCRKATATLAIDRAKRAVAL